MTPTVEPGARRAFGRLFIFIAPVALWRMCCETAQTVRDTIVKSAATVRSARADRLARHTDWDTTIALLAVTEPRIAREVRRRQSMACVAALFFLVGLYGVLAWSALVPGIGCAGLAAVYYLQAALRLHQIRHHEFVSLGAYFARVKRQPRELLPLGLPSGWTLYAGSSR